MQYLSTPLGGTEQPFATWNDGFTTEELDKLETLAAEASEPSLVGSASGYGENPDIRRSKLSWLNNSPDNNWIFDRLNFQLQTLNRQFWQMDLTGFGEPLQLTRYEGGEEGHYDWHQDYGAVVSRKLSIVVQLTDPDLYEGGELQLMTSCKPINVEKKRGLVAVFPSYQLHRVSPVTSGIRHTLVAWMSGPRFR